MVELNLKTYNGTEQINPKKGGEVADLSRHPLSCAVSVSELFFVCASMNA